jgi:hypothetical protein
VIIDASQRESALLQRHINNLPGMLSVILAILSLRVKDGACSPKNRAVYDEKMSLAGWALKSLQNCCVSPPLSSGLDYVHDQAAIILLPSIVSEVFESAGYEPVIGLARSRKSDPFLAHEDHFESASLELGITFTRLSSHFK